MAAAALDALRKLREKTYRGPGRPRKGATRDTHRVAVRLTREEYDILERAAAIQRRNNAEFARLAILDAAQRVCLDPGNGGDQ